MKRFALPLLIIASAGIVLNIILVILGEMSVLSAVLVTLCFASMIYTASTSCKRK